MMLRDRTSCSGWLVFCCRHFVVCCLASAKMSLKTVHEQLKVIFVLFSFADYILSGFADSLVQNFIPCTGLNLLCLV